MQTLKFKDFIFSSITRNELINKRTHTYYIGTPRFTFFYYTLRDILIKDVILVVDIFFLNYSSSFISYKYTTVPRRYRTVRTIIFVSTAPSAYYFLGNHFVHHIILLLFTSKLFIYLN